MVTTAGKARTSITHSASGTPNVELVNAEDVRDRLRDQRGRAADGVQIDRRPGLTRGQRARSHAALADHGPHAEVLQDLRLVRLLPVLVVGPAATNRYCLVSSPATTGPQW